LNASAKEVGVRIAQDEFTYLIWRISINEQRATHAYERNARF